MAETIDEIVVRLEQLHMPDDIRSLIASWRERGEALNRERALIRYAALDEAAEIARNVQIEVNAAGIEDCVVASDIEDAILSLKTKDIGDAK